MQTEKAKSSHFDRTRGLKNQIFPTQDYFRIQSSKCNTMSRFLLEGKVIIHKWSGEQFLWNKI
jgi:hypothetical protein